MVGSAKMKEGWLGIHGWQLKLWRDILAARGSPLEVLDLNPQAGLPSLEHQNQERKPITSSC